MKSMRSRWLSRFLKPRATRGCGSMRPLAAHPTLICEEPNLAIIGYLDRVRRR